MSSAPSSPESPRQIVRSNSNSPPTHVLPPPPAAIDLRHMTSNSGLASSSAGGRRTSQHFLRTSDTRGLGSPNSIPSSPTSIHSSSSAIFERDIEPILISPSSPPHSSSLFGPPPLPLSPASATSSSAHPHVTSVSSTHSTSHSPHKPVDPHRIPRAKATEQLEQSVPSVLDSAAAILTNLSSEADQDAVQVVAPGTLSFAGFDSLILGGGGGPAASFGSGGSIVSPGGATAVGGVGAAQGRTAVRGGGTGSGFASPLSLRSRSPSPGGKSPASGAGAAPVQGLLNIPSPVVSPHVLSSTSASSPPPPDGKTASPSPAGSPRLSSPPPLAAPTNATTTSHPPSPTHAPTKRLSFMSYSDLLASTPTSTHTLSSLTTSASSFEPPPHIPVVSGLNIASAIAASVGSASASPSVSKAGSVRGVSLSGSVVGPPPGGLTHPGMRESIALLDNVGGEWEREGMGKGLEERLEELSVMSSGASAAGGSPLSLRGGLPNVSVNVVSAGGAVVHGKEVEVGKA